MFERSVVVIEKVEGVPLPLVNQVVRWGADEGSPHGQATVAALFEETNVWIGRRLLVSEERSRAENYEILVKRGTGHPLAFKIIGVCLVARYEVVSVPAVTPWEVEWLLREGGEIREEIATDV